MGDTFADALLNFSVPRTTCSAPRSGEDARKTFMPPTPPSRSQASGSADQPQVANSHVGPQGYGARTASLGAGFDEQAHSIAELFAQALDGAMALVRADGGELATLDDARQVLVLRARRTRPLIESALGPIGAPGRSSQPHRPTLPGPPTGALTAAYSSSTFTP